MTVEDFIEDYERDNGDLCIACGYWVPAIGALCEACALEETDGGPL